MDAITGTDETAYKSLDVGKRNTVVKNVLRWERSQIGECLEIFFRETDLNRTGQISLAEFKQMVIRWGARYQDKLSKDVLSDVAPKF